MRGMSPTVDSSRRAKLILCFAAVYLIWGSTYLVASIAINVGFATLSLLAGRAARYLLQG